MAIFSTKFFRTGLVLACFLMLFWGEAAHSAERVVLQLKWTHAFQFAGYYAAQAKGFYREENLEVDIREAGPGTDVIAEVLAGNAQFGVGTSSLILARKAGKPVVALAAIFQHSPLVLLAGKRPDLQSVRDLAGQRIMFEAFSEELLAYLKREGVPPEKLVSVSHSFSPQDLIDGRVDAISAYLTNEPFLLRQAGFDFLMLTPRAAGIDFYGDNLFTSEQEIERSPERVEAFRRASLRGWTYAIAHPEEMVDLISRTYPDRQTREFLTFEAEKTVPLIRSDLLEVGYMNPGRWRHIADTYAEIGMLPRGFPLDGFLYSVAVGQDAHKLYIALAIALVIIGLVGGVALYSVGLNRRLRRSQEALAGRTQELLIQNRVLELINHGQPLDSLLTELLTSIEAQHPGMLCSIVQLDASGRFLGKTIAPSLPAFYNAKVEGLPIGEGIGSCGTAAFLGKRVVVEDVLTHPYWAAFRDTMEKTELRSCWSQPFLNQTGQVLGTFAIYRKVPGVPTEAELHQIENYARLAQLGIERSRHDAALKASEARYRLIADNSSDVIWLLELPELTFSYISPSVSRLRGWTAEEIMAQPLGAALTPASAKLVQESLAASLRRIAAGDTNARYTQLEVDQPCKDGRIIPTEVVTTILLDEQGEPCRILGITRDISERRRAEAELEQYRVNLEKRVEERTAALSVAKELAESANRAKSTFLATMSHELRTPMNAIIGMTDLALRRATDDKQRSYLEKVVKASGHLLVVINDILDLSRIEAERLSLERIAFRLGNVFDNARDMLGQGAAERNIALLFEVPPALTELSVVGDPSRLEQVLLNLLGNAVKFTEHGQVVVRAALVEAQESEFLLRFEVEDTGIGIQLADQPRLFDAFEQADGSMTRKYGGSGLGLAICKHLVRLMGGEIGVRSEFGRGSLFWFSARFGKPAKMSGEAVVADAVSAESMLRSLHAGRRILLAEDEPINQEVARVLLEELGMCVDVAEDGRQAVDLLARGHYDLVLMDMQMPRMDGLEATRQIRAAALGGDVPIIAMTANAFEEDRERCRAAGMNDHIAKPVNPERFFMTLLRWLPSASG